MFHVSPLFVMAVSASLGAGLLASVAQGGDAARVGDAAVAQSTLAQMPIHSATIFKDGHAFVAHEGELPVGKDGLVTLDYLPTPVLGTFWSYSSDEDATLVSVTAGRRAVAVERTALDIRGMLEANPGARVSIREIPVGNTESARYPATIIGVPTRTPEELAATSPPGAEPQLAQKGQVIQLKTDEGIKVIAIDRIMDVTFIDAPRAMASEQEFRNVLTLKFAFRDGKRPEKVRVGMGYVQRGIRWIPNYRLSLGDKGKATVELQATLLNELAPLEGVHVQLAIGVPTFSFKDTLDPISMQQAAARLSQYFQQNEGLSNGIATNFSNSLMTQTARMGDFRQAQPQPAGADLGPDVAEGKAEEDLFLFSIPGVSLGKGERQVMPVVKFDLSYEDVYTLELPFAPPIEARQQFNTQQQAELARLYAAPKAMHKLRLKNSSKYPLTTAPATILRGGRVLSQGMMTYTSRGAATDLALTTATDIQVRRSDLETKRVPAAERWHNTELARIDVEGKIHLVNHRPEPVRIEVTRHILGRITAADNQGEFSQLGSQQDDWEVSDAAVPMWWHWYGWPAWWRSFNGVGRSKWSITLDSGKSVDLGYQWHYYWQ